MSKATDNAKRKRRIEKRKKRRNADYPNYTLDLNKKKYPGHVVLANQIESLIDRRKFLPTVAFGIPLVMELEEENIDLLLEHYGSWLVDKILTKALLSGNEGLKKFVTEIVKQTILEAPPVNFPPQSPNGNGLQNRATQIALPDDDDKVVVRVDANAGANVTANFLGAAFGFQGIPAPAPKTSGGIKEMKIPKIAAPSFDDESDDIVFKH